MVEIRQILLENERRGEIINAPFNPITGLGSVGERVHFSLSDFDIPMYLPKPMMKNRLVAKLKRAGSIEKFLLSMGEEPTEDNRSKVVEQLVRIRYVHDFPFWAATLAYIKRKGGGDDILFRLNRPQRKLIDKLEAMRLAGKPIRLIILKARQWGGSTAIQLYMAWLQLIHEVGLNSLIVGHQYTSSAEVKDMFDRLIRRYPVSMMYPMGADYDENEVKLTSVASMPNIQRIPQRNCKIKLGTAERPDSARGGDYNLVHCTEVGIWTKTDGKTPQEIVSAACGGVLYLPMTMIVYESTAKGTGNFFHTEWLAAERGESQFEGLFISWYEIDLYSLAFGSDEEREEFARWLWENRNNTYTQSARQQSGQYYWWLWEKGATLESIHWYTKERAKYDDHGYMASEYPSDPEEAFVHSGQKVFDKYKVEAMRATCCAPKLIGDIYGRSAYGKEALIDIRICEDMQGQLCVWSFPDVPSDERVLNRYLVVVDIGGRGAKADYSVITVFDRIMVADGGKVMVVAQWRGHIDMDLLAWKSAQIASIYDNALLVIESNTLETRDRDRSVDGDHSGYILNQIADVYTNLYARPQSEEEIIERAPLKYGFHTNTKTKPIIIDSLIRAIREAEYIEMDTRCIDEYLCYERKPNGSYGAISGRHDDMLMTRAIGMYISNGMPIPKVVVRSGRSSYSKTKRIVSEASL